MVSSSAAKRRISRASAHLLSGSRTAAERLSADDAGGVAVLTTAFAASSGTAMDSWASVRTEVGAAHLLSELRDHGFVFVRRRCDVQALDRPRRPTCGPSERCYACAHRYEPGDVRTGQLFDTTAQIFADPALHTQFYKDPEEDANQTEMKPGSYSSYNRIPSVGKEYMFAKPDQLGRLVPPRQQNDEVSVRFEVRQPAATAVLRWSRLYMRVAAEISPRIDRC